MALETNELFDSASRSNDGRMISRRNMVVTLAAYNPSSGADILLPVGTPLSHDASANLKTVLYDVATRSQLLLIKGLPGVQH